MHCRSRPLRWIKRLQYCCLSNNTLQLYIRYTWAFCYGTLTINTNDFGYDVDHNFVNQIDLDLTDLDLIDLGQDNLDLDRINQNHKIDWVDYVVEINLQSISIDSHQEMN